ncbi:unnamed protein product, partial [Choristocarpus tenellus]
KARLSSSTNTHPTAPSAQQQAPPRPSPSPLPKVSSEPQPWTPLTLPLEVGSLGSGVVAGAKAATGIGVEYLAPYGEAGLAAALMGPPVRLQHRLAEGDPFSQHFLIPAKVAKALAMACSALAEDYEGGAVRELEVLENAVSAVECCFHRSAREGLGEGRDGNVDDENIKSSSAGEVGEEKAGQESVTSNKAFSVEVSGQLAAAILRSLNVFRGVNGAGRRGGGVQVYPDGTVEVDTTPSKIALAGLRLAEASATAPGPAREFLSKGIFHVLWGLLSEVSTGITPVGVAVAVGTVCQGLRHPEVMREFVERREAWGRGIGDAEARMEEEREGQSGYESFAILMSRKVSY